MCGGGVFSCMVLSLALLVVGLEAWAWDFPFSWFWCTSLSLSLGFYEFLFDALEHGFGCFTGLAVGWVLRALMVWWDFWCVGLILCDCDWGVVVEWLVRGMC